MLAKMLLEREPKPRESGPSCVTNFLPNKYSVVEQRANAAEARASVLVVELCSARAEANELGQSRLQQGLEAQIIIETLRGECADNQSQASVEISILRSELDDAKSQSTSSFQSESTLQELLMQSQET